MEDEMEIIKEYFDNGYTSNVILDMLSTHYDINMTLGTLKAQLKEFGLRRRDNIFSTHEAHPAHTPLRGRRCQKQPTAQRTSSQSVYSS